ncbi:Endonuclease/Exonuclease/phosphatase family protein [Stieleria maiorica]|uniref:Endonuclease/Exonuclease/phosphatase family protein n=1 Tax=Stieleria maiorica TaxID=2795974 RepID=A0A5B9MCS6_9BACT|nr:endonuclease/exonuclease/phosphatase family protein [Stieleria maiorica]QEF99042.1 Endonuclease/Exonuclease/phosphatase family protein [Stieleria maiorica]
MPGLIDWIGKLARFLARIGVIAVLLGTSATLPARWFWFSDLLASLRIQQLIAAGITVLFCLLVKQFRLALIGSICISVHLVPMMPELVPAAVSGPAGNAPLRLMTMNVLTRNQDYQRVVDEIRQVDPDLVAVLELSSGLNGYLSNGLADVYPHAVSSPEDTGNFGIGVFSKRPFDEARMFQLNENITSIEVVCDGNLIVATHPLPPMGSRGFRSRNEHLTLLAERMVRHRHDFPERSVAVLGDFNVTPWSPHFRRFQRESGLIRAKLGIAVMPTWYARDSSFPFGLVLDHIFISDSLRCVDYRVGRDVGSDHRSVSVALTHTKS